MFMFSNHERLAMLLEADLIFNRAYQDKFRNQFGILCAFEDDYKPHTIDSLLGNLLCKVPAMLKSLRVKNFYISMRPWFKDRPQDADIEIDKIYGMLLKAAMARINDAGSDKSEIVDVPIGKGVILQLHYDNGTMSKVVAIRAHYYANVDIACFDINGVFAAVMGAYSSSHSTFDNYIKDYVYGKSFYIDIESDRRITTRQLPLSRS